STQVVSAVLERPRPPVASLELLRKSALMRALAKHASSARIALLVVTYGCGARTALDTNFVIVDGTGGAHPVGGTSGRAGAGGVEMMSGGAAGASAGGHMGCAPPTVPERATWSPKTAIALDDCSAFDRALMFRQGACLDGSEVLALSDNGAIAVLFGSTLRARFAAGQWSAWRTKPVPHNNEPAYRPWLSSCGERFFVSYRDGSGANPQGSVMGLTLDESTWSESQDRWPAPMRVAAGFRAAAQVPPAPTGSGAFIDDMLLSDDGLHAVLLAFSGTGPARLVHWDGARWAELSPPDPVQFVQWPGAWTGGQGGLTAAGEIGINAQGLMVKPLGESGPTHFASYSNGSWEQLTDYPVLHFQMKVARDAQRAIIGEVQGNCAVWTGTDWTFAPDTGASALEYERTIGISANGQLAVCAGDSGVLSQGSTAAPPVLSVWDGDVWNPQAVGDSTCLVRDVAVAQNGALAAVALTCQPPGANLELPQVVLAIYRSGQWTLSTIADTQVNPGIGPTSESGTPSPSTTRGIASAGPRIAVSADGTTAIAVWGEPGGAYAAYYR
ncbi:MAG TPA: hypothetical protein VIM73_18335, partial [Polyangiaceae bacterium]